MARPAAPTLIDSRVLKAQSHPIRAHILNMLCDGPNSPGRMQRQMQNVSLSLVCHHVKVLRDVGLIELVEVKKHGGRKEHIYRATKDRQFFDLQQWESIDPKFRDPIVGTILQQISEDAGRAAAEGRFNSMPDRHLSRTPLELDRRGWTEVCDALEGALTKVLDAHARSKERVYESGEELMAARVMILQFPIGKQEPIEDEEDAG